MGETGPMRSFAPPPSSPRMILALLALWTGLAGLASPPDTTRPGIEVGLRPRLGAFYSPTKGFGAGGRVTVRHALWPGSVVRFDGRLQQRYAEVGAAVFTGDPFEAPLVAGVLGRYTNDRVHAFYGLGPGSRVGDKLYAEVERAEAELRVGWYPLGTPLLVVQPDLRLLHARVHDFREAREGAFERLDPASQWNLVDAEGHATTGIAYGLGAALDTRDHAAYPSSGVLVSASVRRYDGLDEPRFPHVTATASLFGFVPLPARRHVLFGRAVLITTDPLGDEPLPFHLLPVLDDKLLGAYTRHRFVGHDVVALTLGYRFPLVTLLDWFALDANLHLHAANAYDDVTAQFDPAVSFDAAPATAERVPLRPAISVGLDVVNLDGDRVVLGGQLGVDPEGFRFGTFRVAYDLRDVRPAVR